MYSFLLSQIVDHFAEDTPQLFTKTILPTTVDDFRHYYLKGKHAIPPNQPVPSVRGLESNAYVSLKDIIAHVLASGVPLDDEFDIRLGADGTGEDDGMVVTSFAQSKMAATLRTKLIWDAMYDDPARLRGVFYVTRYSAAVRVGRFTLVNDGIICLSVQCVEVIAFPSLLPE
jgi:hypothetical protein